MIVKVTVMLVVTVTVSVTVTITVTVNMLVTIWRKDAAPVRAGRMCTKWQTLYLGEGRTYRSMTSGDWLSATPILLLSCFRGPGAGRGKPLMKYEEGVVRIRQCFDPLLSHATLHRSDFIVKPACSLTGAARGERHRVEFKLQLQVRLEIQVTLTRLCFVFR